MIGNNNDDDSEMSFSEKDLEFEDDEEIKSFVGWNGLKEYSEDDYFINNINDIIKTTSEIFYFGVGFVLASPFILLIFIFSLIVSFKSRGVK